MSVARETMWHMTTRICWNCNVAAHQTAIEGSGGAVPQAGNYGTGRYKIFGAFKCDSCHHYSIGTRIAHLSSVTSRAVLAEFLEGNPDWLPVRAAGKKFLDVPEHIAGAADEAHQCFSIGAYRAVGSLVRAVVEATAKDRDITKGTLEEKIGEMKKQQLVTPHVADVAHELRIFGNDMAHGDFVDPVFEEDAEEVLVLMDELLDDVYQSRARVRVRAEKRAAKKAERALEADAGSK